MFTYTTGPLPGGETITCNCCSGCPESKRGAVIDAAGASVLPKTFIFQNNKCNCCGNFNTFRRQRASQDESHAYQSGYREPNANVPQRTIVGGVDGADGPNGENFRRSLNRNVSSSSPQYSNFLYSTNFEANSMQSDFSKRYSTQ
uniref:Uncharacterized protein n=2 Tax=Photinus pyralis TaxID=7054 RepID=A0A1Y1L6G7_PHOPY